MLRKCTRKPMKRNNAGHIDGTNRGALVAHHTFLIHEGGGPPQLHREVPGLAGHGRHFGVGVHLDMPIFPQSLVIDFQSAGGRA